jgi:hypothetical protein
MKWLIRYLGLSLVMLSAAVAETSVGKDRTEALCSARLR